MNDEFGNWAQGNYGKLKPDELHCGKLHAFLGMELDFSEPWKYKVKQFGHVDKVLEEWPKRLDPKQTLLTPASNTFFAKGDGLLLNAGQRELFHCLVMKGLFIAGRSRPDIAPTIAVLSGRVCEPNEDD